MDIFSLYLQIKRKNKVKGRKKIERRKTVGKERKKNDKETRGWRGEIITENGRKEKRQERKEQIGKEFTKMEF